MSQTGKGFRSERRGFLIGVASAALGAVALPASAQSLRGKPRSKIGVIGAGHIGGTIGGIWVGVGHPV
ncbi:MAG TPA: NADP oxidoreductase, partial [Cupriavidus sp.]|nr:NADP oxidoreductase [Cupriavidus sp.]